MPFRGQEGLILVLAVYVDQPPPHVPQDGDRHRAAADAAGPLSSGRDSPLDEPAPASSLQRDEAYFWLTVTGDSMEPILCEGDLVLVRKQTSVDNGSMAVVLVGGEEGLVKKIFYGPDWIELHSLNPAYAVRRFEGPDVMQVAVLGLVMESKRKFI